jgi:glutaredoxin-related protein
MAAHEHISKEQMIHVQPALFDVHKDVEKYEVSEAVRGLTALGTHSDWRTMGQLYVDGKPVQF